MKHFFSTILITFYWLSGLAQTVSHIDKLPENGLVLNNGWRYKYAQVDYNDSKWQQIDPTKDVYRLKELKKGIVWLRLRFAVDSTLVGHLCMLIQQSGASEIYLNGHLIHRFGIVSADLNKVKAFNPLWKQLSLPITNSNTQLLAVRYVLQPGIHYSYFLNSENKGLEMIVNTVENAAKTYGQVVPLEGSRHIFKIGVFLILSVLYFAFYIFYPAQKVNLLFSLYALLQALNFFMVGQMRSINPIENWFPFHLIVNINQVFDYLMLLYAIYRLLEHKRGLMYWFLVAFAIICIPINFIPRPWGWMIYGFVFTTLLNLDITRISLLAINKRKKGAWIIASGGIGYLVFWFIMTAAFFQLFTNTYSDVLYSIFFELSFLAIPISVSIYLGYDFALTHRTLQQKYTEVETLSNEKQQILAAQNITLEKQVEQRTVELKKSLQELKATQSQLIQSEKMASLGELTAGIAHEIQNPLNFVNNFSEVNAELIEELKGERSKVKSEKDDQLEDELLNDIAENERKINYHGKRAHAIVKGMLQHSRVSGGKKEPTDINALADEYLRLSYHGLRAKDKSFNATIETHFDESIGKIEVVPQDIGRVLLNLFNNAFYAVKPPNPLKGEHYDPKVTVTTKRVSSPSGVGRLEIHVRENGVGIPQKVVDKIFQPFFTTKPTGQGTGLGLSLSYDIIKAHGGEIRVVSREGKGAEFIVILS